MIDPIELEITRNLFEAAAEEMGIVLQRVAYSANIKERRDFSCALFDNTGALLAQAAHVPVHLGAMPATVAAVIGRLGTLEAGDVAIVNDPFAGGSHLPDITLVSPIFHGTRLIGYAANRAHHSDVGGISPGSMVLSTHIDEEGIRIEPEFLHVRGRRNNELLERLMRAVRTPRERLGDLDAQLAALAVGERALIKMVDRRGVDRVLECGNALIGYARQFMSRVLADMPEGAFSFEDVLDDDGAGSGPVPIRVRITLGGSRAVVDLRDCGEQVRGCVNCPRAVTESAVFYCFACLLDGSSPLNGGCFADIEVLTRPGSIVHAQYPAAVVAGNTETSQRIVDVVFGALARAMPERIPAASCGTMSSIALGGPHWTYYETVGGGSGAAHDGPGEHAVQCHMTNTLNTPAEALEMQYPLRVRRFERAVGSGGSGRNAGGDGIVREIEVLGDCSGTILSDRRTSTPYGLRGGASGVAGLNEILGDAGAGPAIALPGKTRFTLRKGDRLRIRTPGGGGWGSPG